MDVESRYRHTEMSSPKRGARRRGSVSASPRASLMPDHFMRSAILAAATNVFARRGIRAVRVEDILEGANIARRTFYKYFASKEEVLAALYDVWTGELLRAVQAVQANQPNDPAWIHSGIDIFFGFYQNGPRALIELVEVAMMSDSLLAPRRRWLRAEIVRLMADSIHAIDGRKLDPLVFYGLLSALEGIALELDGANKTEADVERARNVIHALADSALGLPNPKPLPSSA